MTRRTTTLFAALLAAALISPAFANPSHHPAAAALPGGSQMGMGGEMMANTGMMSNMHGGMMRHMRQMTANMHGAPVGQMEGMMQHANAGMLSLERLSGAEFDQAFIATMIAHHRGAIDMADWVLDRGDDPEVLAAARAVKAAQEPEIEQMTSWLREWYDTDVDAASAAPMDAAMGGMMTTTAAGSDPDTAFLLEMVRHHQGAIDMAQLALERATRPELRALARDVIVTQADEVHQYQVWLDDSTN